MYACKKGVAAYFGIHLNKKKKDVFDRKKRSGRRRAGPEKGRPETDVYVSRKQA